MAEQTSSLIVRLIDKVTGPAKAIVAAIKGIGSASKQSSGITFADRIDAAIARNNARLSTYRMQMLDVYATAMTLYRGLKRPIESAKEYESALTELGNKSGMTKEQLAAFGKQAVALSKQTNQFTADLLKAADILIGAGMDAETAAKSINTIGRAATATGASIDDLSKLANASIANLKVPVEQLELAFDKLAQAGKAGGFELKDMAQYFPDLGAAFATFGQEGVGAVADLGAALQIVRRSTGDPSQAANAVSNLLQKARAPLTVKKFKEYGINIRKELDKGIKAGKSPFDVMVEQSRKAMKKGAVMEDLFSDKQVLEAMRPLLAFYDDYVKLREEASKAAGVVLQDFQKKMETNAERTKAFQIALENLSLSIGNALLPALTTILRAITPVVEKIAAWAEAHPKLTAGIIGGLAGLLAFNAATIALKYAGALGYGGLLTLAKGVATVSGAFTTLSGAIAATGIGAIVILLAMAGIWIYNNWKGISAMFDQFGKSFTEALSPSARETLNTVITGVQRLWTWVSNLLGPIDATESKWRSWGAAAGEAVASVVNWFGDLPAMLRRNFDRLYWEFMTRVNQIVLTLQNLPTKMYDIGAKIVTSLWDGLKAQFDQLVAWVKQKAADLTSVFTGIPGKIKGAFGFGGGEEAAPAAAAPAPAGRARGGPVSKGSSYIVGERRAELFTPSQNGYIGQVPKGGAGGATIAPTFNLTFNGSVDQSTVEKIKSVLREEVRQAFRGVYADAGMRFA